ncbi:hypothetical protein Tsubulata_005364 [Turnera subulata]|uniref:O-fucosyltransferase family protein n=1 Tax=Turnera subulata TaxID=218843 RepID=A0A9Q0JNF1_9ROSI|nr:hypothetical protein Tsubulata_005364 [Turnera subulata]
MAMKVNAYNNSNNAAGNNSNNNKGGKSIVGGLSQCRRRLLRSKVQLQAHFKKEGLGSGVFLRRGVRYMMVLSFLYLSLLIMCVGPFSGFVGRAFAPRAVYRSPKLFARLWPDILADNSTPIQLSSVWKYKRRLKMQRPRPCPTSPKQQRYTMVEDSAGPSGYLIVEANGGLNQQRSAICNAVAVAGLLNAVLVIPRFGFNNVWRDPRRATTLLLFLFSFFFF